MVCPLPHRLSPVPSGLGSVAVDENAHIRNPFLPPTRGVRYRGRGSVTWTWMKSLGIADETFDGLRHAHTSWLIALGMQHPKDIQERLGLRHADFSTTMML